MKYKLPPIVIPPEDPFLYDALNRRPSVEALSLLIDKLEGPFVLAIDSPWGTGKTTFIRLWQSVLKENGFTCLYFNSWEADFSIDPMVAFLGELGKLCSGDIKGFTEHYKKAKKIATLLVKKAIPVAGKIATGGLLDLDPYAEKEIANYVSSSLSDAVDRYTAERNLINDFHVTLTKAIEKLNKEGNKKQIVIFVDELDRCRPTYAVALLERIKHLFNIENVIFVIALDKRQLGVSLGAVYGQGINSDEYLRRFIDLEYTLSKPDAKAFTESLFERFEFNEFFSSRTHHDLIYEKKDLVNTFVALSEIFSLNLRAREQCFSRIRVAMMLTPETHYFFPYLVTALTILRVGAYPLYCRYALENGSAKEIINYFDQTEEGAKFLNGHIGTVMEAFIIGARDEYAGSEEFQKHVEIQRNASLSDLERERPNKIISIISQWSTSDKIPSLSYVVNKLELTAQFKR